MVNTNPNTPDNGDIFANKAFLDAKERYERMRQAEVLSSDGPDPNIIAMERVVDSLKKFADTNGTKITVPRGKTIASANRNKPELPVPLPVKPIDPTLVASRDRTNKLLTKIDKSVTDSAIPSPIKIDDKKIAHESTLRDAVNVLKEISTNGKVLGEDLNKKFESLAGSFSAYMKDDEFEVKAEKRQGWIAKMLERYTDFIGKSGAKIATLGDILKSLGKPLIKENEEQRELLSNIYDIQREAHASKSLKARESLEPVGPWEGLMDVLAPSGTYLGKITESTSKVIDVFKNIGKSTEEILKKADSAMGGGMFSVAGFGRVGGWILRFLGVFGGIGGLVASVVGGVAFASLYAMFKNPDQLIGMMGAFSNLFTEAILPAFQWITTEIIPPLTVAFTALMVVADKLLDTVGTYINEKLIYIIGTALPDVLRLFGRMIDDAWQGVKEIVLRVSGAFGVGPYADRGIFENIFQALITIPDSLLNIISEFATEVIKSLGYADLFGLREGEGIYGRIKRFFTEDLVNFVNETFDKITNYFIELDPINTIKDKIKGFIDSIIGIIPSWNDIKSMISNAMPSATPDFIKDYFNKLLGVSAAAIDTKAHEKVNQVLTTPKNDRIAPIPRNLDRSKEIELSNRFQYPSSHGPVIIAPQTNNNTSISNKGSTPFVGNMNSSAPNSTLDNMIYRGRAY